MLHRAKNYLLDEENLDTNTADELREGAADNVKLAQSLNLLTSKWVEVSEPAQLARCLQPICHRVTTID